MIKARIRKITRRIAEWPLVGRFVKIGVAVIRLPEFQSEHLNLNHRQYLFETKQLPTLLNTLSEINHRQLASDYDKDNLIQSVPIALRKITRDIIEVRQQLETISSSIEQHTHESKAKIENILPPLNQHINETRQKIKDISNTSSYLLGRVEFVRRELMFEMRYGASSPLNENEHIKAKTKIISSEKLEIARQKQLQLNLGCGHIPLENYLNVDRRALPGVDIVAEVDELPFEQNELDKIFSAHLLEHFPQEQLRREILPYWIRLLKQGGEFHAVVPDAEAMIQNYVNNGYPYTCLREVTFGSQDFDGDFHFNMFTPESLSNLLTEAGLVNVEIVDQARKSGDCFEFEIKATRPHEKI